MYVSDQAFQVLKIKSLDIRWLGPNIISDISTLTIHKEKMYNINCKTVN